MTGRPRHGLHLVRNGDPPAPDTVAAPHPEAPRRPTLTLTQETVVLALRGQLNADTAGRLRMFLSMFTMDGGPQELVLDLRGVHLVDEAGMAPIHEADEAQRMRSATLRLVAPSPAVSHLLTDLRGTRSVPAGVLDVVPALEDGHEVPEPDGP
jgi:anti-anti-sigma factor